MKLRNPVAGLILATLYLLGVSPAGCLGADLPPLSHSLTRQPPQPAPALKLADLVGTPHDLAQLRGRVVLVNFWATWCPPCRREIPSMERLSQILKGEAFSVLAVDIGEDADTVDAFTSQFDSAPSFPMLLDTHSHVLQAWKAAGLPTTFLVDQQGRIVASAIGGREFDHPEIVQTIRELLKQ
jgi:thiol-disulfide isomerase/thioredoxin